MSLSKRVFHGKRLVCLATLLAPISSAYAATPPLDTDPNQGISRTSHDISDRADAASGSLNPALLRDTSRWQLSLLGYQGANSAALASGYGGFFSWNFKRFGAVAFGFEGLFTSQGPADTVTRWRASPVYRSSLAFAFGSPRSLSFGVNFSRLSSRHLPGQGLAIDVGLLQRFGQLASLGLDVGLHPIDLQSQSTRPASLQAATELTLRPWRNDFLSLAGGVRLVADHDLLRGNRDLSASDWLPRMRIASRLGGIELYGEVEEVRTYLQALAGVPNSVAPAPKTWWRAGFGVRWRGRNGDIGTGGHIGQSESQNGWSIQANLHADDTTRPVYYTSEDTYVLRLSQISGESEFAQTLLVLQEMARSHHDASLLLVLDRKDLGWSRTQELHQALSALADAGIKTTAYFNNASYESYVLASIASEIVMHPAGELDLAGIAKTKHYYGDLLARAGIHVDVFGTGSHKSAYDQWKRHDRSDADREQTEAYVGGGFEELQTLLEQSPDRRHLGLKQAVGQRSLSSREAKAVALVDKVGYLDDLTTSATVLDISGRDDFGAGPAHWGKDPYLAVVVLEGMIVSGEGMQLPAFGLNQLGSKRVAQTLEALRNDPACRGAVIRINSPGGSALASNEMWHAVERFSRGPDADDPSDDRPVIASIGNVGASGGYYLAQAAQEIYASSAAIVGSIGVIAADIDMTQLLEKWSVGEDTIGRGELARQRDGVRRMGPLARADVEHSVDETYQAFLQKVAEGRKMQVDAVRAIAGGRVYLSRDAAKLGLIDRQAGLLAAVDRLRQLTCERNHDPLHVRVVEDESSWLQLSASSKLAAKSAQDWLLQTLLEQVGGRELVRQLMSLLVLSQEGAFLYEPAVSAYEGETQLASPPAAATTSTAASKLFSRLRR